MKPAEQVSPVVGPLRELSTQLGRPLTYAEFSEIALYHPQYGYYRRDRRRVGKDQQSDFFTSSSVGPVFVELVAAAAARLLLESGLDPAKTVFVEIGAEPGETAAAETTGLFQRFQTIRLGEPLAWESPCVVFSNELFDAQPFHRLIFTGGRWVETGVTVSDHGDLREVLLAEMSPTLTDWLHRLPRESIEGYSLDLSLSANTLLRQLTEAPWQGLFLAFDYGKSWRELTGETPQGTARAYLRHRQHNDLLNQPGQQDLTCHVCWDWLEAELVGQGFTQTEVLPQESFLVKYATHTIQQMVERRPGEFDSRRRQLQQLLHPAAMGQKFQVLHGIRKNQPVT